MFDSDKLRRAGYKDVQKILLATPEKAWVGPRGPGEGVDFEIHSTFNLRALSRAFPTQSRGLHDGLPDQLVRSTRIRSAGGFTRTDEMPGGRRADNAAYALENPELGALYVDVKDRSYIHFSANQLPQVALPTSLKKLPLKWEVVEGEGSLTIALRGRVSLDVVIEYSSANQLAPQAATVILAAVLPGLGELAELGLSIEKIKLRRAPNSIETWLVDSTGRRVTQMARHRIAALATGPLDSQLFGLPPRLHNLRDRSPTGEREWHPIGRPRRRKRRDKALSGSKALAFRTARAPSAVLAAPGQPPMREVAIPQIDPELVLPGCQPSTLYVSSALEIQQSLLDAIQYVVNLMARRLDGAATGTRIDPNDPENTDVRLVLDWLAQLERFNENEPNGDGLFCLLRDTEGGGQGLLDQFAVTLARDLVAAGDPIPLGGADNPINLPQAIEDAITALAADDTIPAADRFDELGPDAQATVIQEVLDQRLGTISHRFDGDFGSQRLPSSDFDLVDVKLQLEQLELRFSGADVIRRLLITLLEGDANRPQIEFEAAIERLSATLTMERTPGRHFWLTAAGVLVALGIIGPVAIGGVVATLVGLGPLGLLIVALMIQGAPVALVAGGALLLAVVTYLVWDVTQLRVTLGQPILRSSVAPDRASDPEEVVLDPDRVSIDGEYSASVNSRIPSGIHQVLDAVFNFAIEQCDRLIVEKVESSALDGLEGLFRSLPQFCLPQPSDTAVEVSGLTVQPVNFHVPRHHLGPMSANGVTERLLSAGALTAMKFPYPGFAPSATQVDLDLREKLTQRMTELRGPALTPRLGYAISQNLLNGIVFGRWLAGRFRVDYDENQIAEAFDTLIAACPDCAKVTERAISIWAAAPPQVFVTPRAYWELETKPYLSALFPDVRICIAGVLGKDSTLEIQFSVESVAHVGLGGQAVGNALTFFSLGRNFLHVLFDARREFRRLNPVGTQGLEVSGPGFGSIGAMSERQRVQLLADLLPLLENAARRLLQRDDAAQLAFQPNSPRLDVQIYDGMIRADVQPRRASLFVVLSASGPFATALPRRDENDRLIVPGAGTGLLDLDNMTCEQGKDLRPERGADGS